MNVLCGILPVMKLKYALVGAGAIVLILVVIATLYGISYLKEQSAALKLKNDVASELRKPHISLDGVSCDIAPDTKTQSYFVVIRTSNVATGNKQKQVEDRIKAFDGTIVSTNQEKTYGQNAGYSDSATVNASLPFAKTDALISKIKSDIVPPDYTENENRYVQDSATLRQSCEDELDSLKDLISMEALYLIQLDSGKTTAPAPICPIPAPTPYPPPPPSVSPYYSQETGGSVIQNLTDVRQNARSLRDSIGNIMNQLNKTQITLSIKEIPGR